MPSPELRPTTAQVRRLLRDQLPSSLRALAEARLEPAAQGWDNAMFRLGPSHAVRLPVRRASVPCLLHEMRWTAEVSAPLDALGIAAPRPVFGGRPGAGYPWPWLVTPWIEGEAVATLPVAERGRIAGDLAGALTALHRPAPAAAPRNPYRGVPLADRIASVGPRWPAVAQRIGTERTGQLRAVVERGLRAEPWGRPPVWLHGDPHPWNLVQRQGRLAGVVDFGDVCGGDPASDLATAWLTLDGPQRAAFRAVVDATGTYDDAVWARAAAWAALLVGVLAADQASARQFGPVVEHAAAQLDAVGGLEP
ncbi:aminoglycoside phosphotransferase family protein [Kocuria rosea]|uniref:aminoglycoside phosphotransferase family protein n=1 Tax=Kocuria rosea TaxID=1275 RepID=UPI00203BA257|nr:aminoglycoside phosphotransferase family protein [Kocuria rosea]MCM3687083.1 aminoglycoside phosphotransferase family protein [Kocuria rosea]